MIAEDEELRRVVDFLKAVSRLKTTSRAGWVRCRVPGTPETIGAHSFGVAVLAWILSEELGLDTTKAVKMALTHDLLEAYTGDITPYDVNLVAKREILEQNAVSELEKILPIKVKSEMLLLIRELREEGSPESRVVKQADRLDTAFQAFAYEEIVYGGHPEDSAFFGFFDLAKGARLEGYAQRLLREIERMRGKQGRVD